MKNKKITKKMTFAEVMSKHPETAEVLFKEGMQCFGCSMAGFETIEQGCLAHGLNPEEIVKKMNEKLKGRNKTREKS